MAKRSVFDFSTAYAQLVLLVFLPICVLAGVGAYLVLQETSRTVRTLEQTQANIMLRQSTAVVADKLKATNGATTGLTNDFLSQILPLIQQNTAQNSYWNKHVQGVALVDSQGKILASTGEISTPSNGSKILPKSDYPFFTWIETFKKNQGVSVTDGTLYAQSIATKNPKTSLWLVINLDNEPILLARYQVLLALGLTGLFTILLLLFSLNVYSRRWIEPIYEMRLHLQRTNANNLYKPMAIESSGEINQLQQDLVRTLRRLHTSFQELKNHAEQTEDDLRLAFDEMEMQNISIRNARDMAVSSSQTKSAFLANISHELRTPLNSIDGFINLLSRDTGLTADQNLYVQTIRKSSAHLLALVNDVLDFSKIEAGKLLLEQHEFDLYASIYDVVDMLSPLASEKNLRLAVFFYDDVPRFLLGDSLRVKQVLTNLVNNAIKFTDEGEVVVRVSLDEPTPSDDTPTLQEERIFISVQDTGKGIDTAHQTVLFQSFSQGDPSVTRQYGGTGLGLVISKQLTQLMGGKIGFYDNQTEAEKDLDPAELIGKTVKGTTFWFTLPVHLSPSQQQQHEQALLDEKSLWEMPVLSPTQLNKPLQMLVWITHEASLQILRGTLNQLPIQITVVDSINDLLEKLQQHGKAWDWVIIDNDVKDLDNKHLEIATIFKQIRLYYVGKLVLFGYQINLDTELLSRYQVRALYQPLDRRQLYQLLTTATQATPEVQMPKWQGFSVLAVDDHPPNLLVLEALLAELGISVITANSGFEAIAYIERSIENYPNEQAVDLIFMDIQMPKMSGREASQKIREIESENTQKKHIPIIALTAHSLADEKASLLETGIDDYVGKPINQAQLQQVLQKWLGKQGNQNTQANPISSINLTQPPKMLPPVATVETEKENPSLLMISEHDTPTKELAVIDWDDALMRAAGKTDLAANLMMMLRDSIEQEKADLATAWADKDRQALANIAHRILGASRYTGVPALRQASQNFEDKCLLNVQSQSPAQFILLTPLYEQLVQALDDLQTIDLSPWSALNYYRLEEKDMTWKMI